MSEPTKPAPRPPLAAPTGSAVSDNLIEMMMETDPARWAAYQIAAKSHPEIKTVGAAMEMIEAIVRRAIAMSQNAQRERPAATEEPR